MLIFWAIFPFLGVPAPQDISSGSSIRTLNFQTHVTSEPKAIRISKGYDKYKLHINQFQDEASSYLYPIRDLRDIVAGMSIEDFIWVEGSQTEVGMGGMDRYLYTSAKDDTLPFIHLLLSPPKLS